MAANIEFPATTWGICYGNDFLAVGVRKIWLFGPTERIACTYTHEGLKRDDTGRIAAADSRIYIDVRVIFSKQD